MLAVPLPIWQLKLAKLPQSPENNSMAPLLDEPEIPPPILPIVIVGYEVSATKLYHTSADKLLPQEAETPVTVDPTNVPASALQEVLLVIEVAPEQLSFNTPAELTTQILNPVFEPEVAEGSVVLLEILT